MSACPRCVDMHRRAQAAGHMIRLCSNACWLVYSPLVGAWALMANHATFAAINVLGYYRWRRIEEARTMPDQREDGS